MCERKTLTTTVVKLRKIVKWTKNMERVLCGNWNNNNMTRNIWSEFFLKSKRPRLVCFGIQMKEEKLKCNMRGRTQKTNQWNQTNKRKLNRRKRSKNINNNKNNNNSKNEWIKCKFYSISEWVLSQLLRLSFYSLSLDLALVFSHLQVLLSYTWKKKKLPANFNPAEWVLLVFW